MMLTRQARPYFVVSVFRVAVAVLLFAGNLSSCSADSTASATIVVDASNRIGPVNERVFGDNIEAADSKHVFGDVTNPLPLQSGTGFWDDGAQAPVPAVVSLLRDARVSMLRYPGGSLANMYDWKKAVGPLSSRGEWRFGIDEYIATCRALGAEPQFIVSDYTGTPDDAAELVEYLNAMADDRHPWAQLRAKCGHVEPYHVRWFELGNESDSGGGWPRRQFSAQEYAAYAKATASSMRSVDPSIKIGIISATGKPADDPWNPVVYRLAGPIADFVVVHIYVVGADPVTRPDQVMQACMAVGDQCDEMLKSYHAEIKQALGHDLPLAVTEYNGDFVQEMPIPYRFTLGAALFSADFMRILLKPENNVILANYWQAVNGYWGMIQGGGTTWKFQAEYPLRKLWGRHFGSTLLATTVKSPTETFEGYRSVRPALCVAREYPKAIGGDLLARLPIQPGQQWGGVSWTSSHAGAVDFNLTAVNGNQYITFTTLPAPAATIGRGGHYRFGCDMRAVEASGFGRAKYSLGIGDSRGWTNTYSAAKTPGVPADGAWHHLTGTYNSLSDTSQITVMQRVENAQSAVTGSISLKNLTLSAGIGDVFPAYALLTADASTSSDGDTIFVIVLNKSASDSIPTTLKIERAQVVSARRWTVSGPDLQSTNLSETTVSETETGVETPLESNGTIVHSFPAHSMTAFEIKVR